MGLVVWWVDARGDAHAVKRCAVDVRSICGRYAVEPSQSFDRVPTGPRVWWVDARGDAHAVKRWGAMCGPNLTCCSSAAMGAMGASAG
ncbi:hypothetical protein K227x_39820 [Rubripirellula lacrimiformis]|uniref:Uncharacterized protein n=1 Tax=Rubripirellula lacrimiformis TaxID=1930273 RepID=A0A517NEM6_9BACT|nr:hypothetical protein K227x_39820 [Rubripirellula lacrimiformis]